jgi:Ca2+-binding RTX toxin-like protein
MALRLATFALAALATWIAVPAADGAYVGRGASYTASPGETNHVTASFDGTFVTIADSVPITLGAQATDPEDGNCSQPSPTRVRCAYPYGYQLDLKDGDDSFSFSGPAPPLPLPADMYDTGFFDVVGGDGSDELRGSPYPDNLDGSTIGISESKSPGGFDRLVGGAGDDLLSDHDGSANSFDGGPGDDYLRAPPLVDEGMGTPAKLANPNTMAGGPGKDRFEGGWGNDRIDGNSGPDHLFGDRGRDKLRGGTGKDIIDGGPGRDVADGGPGNDALNASFHGGCGGPDTFIGGSGRDSLYIFCGHPTLRLKDRTRDTVSCSHSVKPKKIVADRKDRLKGRCARHRRRH